MVDGMAVVHRTAPGDTPEMVAAVLATYLRVRKVVTVEGAFPDGRSGQPAGGAHRRPWRCRRKRDVSLLRPRRDDRRPHGIRAFRDGLRRPWRDRGRGTRGNHSGRGEIQGAGHPDQQGPRRTEIGLAGSLNFIFDNIHLPDSTTNEAGSHGYVIFEIKPLAQLPVGTGIGTGAAIYFDYNAPVLTNVVSNTITSSINSPNTAVTYITNGLQASAANASYQWLDCDNGNAPIEGIGRAFSTDRQ